MLKEAAISCTAVCFLVVRSFENRPNMMSDCSTSSVSSHCIWCSHQRKLVEGKKFCHNCQHACKRECITCHRPYPNEKKNFTLDTKRCDSCTTRYENAKLSRKKIGKKFSHKLRIQDIDSADDEDDNDDEEVVMKKKKRRKAKPLSDDEEDADMQNDAESVASSDVLTILDNDSVQEDMEEEEGENNKTLSKKRTTTANDPPPTKTVFDQMMEEAAEKKPLKKPASHHKKGEGSEGRKRNYKKKSPQEKTPIQAEKDLMCAIINYKKSAPHNSQITLVFVP